MLKHTHTHTHTHTTHMCSHTHTHTPRTCAQTHTQTNTHTHTHTHTHTTRAPAHALSETQHVTQLRSRLTSDPARELVRQPLQTLTTKKSDKKLHFGAFLISAPIPTSMDQKFLSKKSTVGGLNPQRTQNHRSFPPDSTGDQFACVWRLHFEKWNHLHFCEVHLAITRRAFDQRGSTS